MTDTLKEKLLLELVNLDAPWVKRIEYNSSGSNLRWLPVAELSGGRFLLGLTADGLWARSTAVAAQIISDETDGVFFLPILEDSPELTREKIIDGLKSYGLSEEFIDTFPFEKVVMEGLGSHSEYWSGLALKWALFVPRSNRLAVEVESLSRVGETQGIRHAARAVFKKFKDSQQ